MVNQTINKTSSQLKQELVNTTNSFNKASKTAKIMNKCATGSACLNFILAGVIVASYLLGWPSLINTIICATCASSIVSFFTFFAVEQYQDNRAMEYQYKQGEIKTEILNLNKQHKSLDKSPSNKQNNTKIQLNKSTINKQNNINTELERE